MEEDGFGQISRTPMSSGDGHSGPVSRAKHAVRVCSCRLAPDFAEDRAPLLYSNAKYIYFCYGDNFL